MSTDVTPTNPSVIATSIITSLFVGATAMPRLEQLPCPDSESEPVNEVARST